MGRKVQVKRSPEEKWEILQEGLRREHCRDLSEAWYSCESLVSLER